MSHRESVDLLRMIDILSIPYIHPSTPQEFGEEFVLNRMLERCLRDGCIKINDIQTMKDIDIIRSIREFHGNISDINLMKSTFDVSNLSQQDMTKLIRLNRSNKIVSVVSTNVTYNKKKFTYLLSTISLYV